MQFVNDLDWQDTSKMNWEEKTADKEPVLIKHEDMRNNKKTSKDLIASLDVEPEKSAGLHPVMVPMNHDFNNDIYFIGKQ